MEPRISIITSPSTISTAPSRFYEAMGLTRHAGITDGVAFFQMGGAILGLFPRDELPKRIPASTSATAPFRRSTLAYNTRSEAEVDEVLAAAEKAGGRIVKPARPRLLGRLVRLFRRHRRPSLGSRPQSGFPDRRRRQRSRCRA